MTTTESQAPAAETAALIEELFCQGHSIEHIIGVGADEGWTPDDVRAVLRDRQWDLDGSGRLPRSKRITAPRGLRTARPTVPTAPAATVRRVAPVERPPLEVIDTRPLDDWVGADAPDEPDEAPAAAQPPAEVFSAIADWADSDESPDPTPAPSPEAAQKASRSKTPAPARPTAPDLSDELVERFLADRTVPASADQFLTSPQLREAFEDWRATADAPAVSPRRFGAALTGRYGKRQATVVIDGVKPMCYFGVAWKPAETPAAESPTVGSAPPAVTVDQVAEVRAELTAAAAAAPPDPTISPAASAQTVDLLATGLEHPDRRVRAAAAAVQRAVDALCTALTGSTRSAASGTRAAQ